MPRKLKFRPRISRVKLNPEQAVLTCNCHSTGNAQQWIHGTTGARASWQPGDPVGVGVCAASRHGHVAYSADPSGRDSIVPNNTSS